MTQSGCVRHDLSLGDGKRWIDLDFNHAGLEQTLQEHIPDWGDLRTSFLSHGAPVGYMEHEGGLFLAFQGANLSDDPKLGDLITVRIWFDESRLVTASQVRTRSVQDVADRVAQDELRAEPALLIFTLAKRLAFHMSTLQQTFESQLDMLEDKVMAAHGGDASLSDADLGRLRREALMLRQRVLDVRRAVVPQIEMLDDLEEDLPSPLQEDDAMRTLQDARLRFSRHREDMESKRDRTILLAEEVASVLEERANRRTYVFTVVAGVFLPIGFVTGLLGVNVGGVPGADHPMAFWWLTGGLAVTGLLLWLKLRDTR